ncbi:uncharacterized protein LOC111914945 [Lactuca sativa]|uniref:DUF674 domain-containing protein n=1 Tax=Lactuca sativa TaxID=4236 RepID=A0A9R1UWC4_LACSA|nr:uncharacterized protein LOC111914945 [Lactuca sativa]KAJ0194713.1 hypothetical protein LSAT_V11C700382740 [Lactuca sativa]
MGTPENSVQLKVFVDKKKKKVMFAEAANDFVDTLFSLFTLPLGTIAKLSRKHADSNDIKFGSLTSLYKSVVSFDRKYIMLEDLLINPKNSSASICKNLKVNLDDTEPIPPHLSSLWGFVMSSANFIITDDLNVIPLTLDTIIVLFNSLGVENINLLEERTMDFGFEEFLNLLMWSLTTNNPLTNLVLGGDVISSWSKQASFMVYNDLEVIPPPSIATFSKLNTLGVPVGDMEVLEVSFGEQEALSLLKVCLTSNQL